MTKRKIIQRTRKWHRYLGLVLGLQFLLWTLGGLYFSWTNIDEIRGDTLKNTDMLFPMDGEYVSPNSFLPEIFTPTDSLQSFRIVSILEVPHYEMVFNSNGKRRVALIDAANGKLRNSLTELEAVQVARVKLKVKAEIENVEYLTSTHNHHEYRERPLPAYAITFGGPANTTVYVSQEYGNVQTFRNNSWRAFDFFWMLHTMDYQTRDDFNNWLLRIFSLFGVFTILSGFVLFFLTSKTINKKKKK